MAALAIVYFDKDRNQITTVNLPTTGQISAAALVPPPGAIYAAWRIV